MDNKYESLNRIYLRKLSENDRKEYGESLMQEPGYENASKAFIDSLFQFELNTSSSDIYSIVLHENNEMCGYCLLSYDKDNVPNIGINLRKEYQGHQYGEEAVMLLVKKYQSRYPDFHCVLKTESTNTKCIKMCEKLGLRYVREEENPYVAILERLEKFNNPDIDIDSIINKDHLKPIKVFCI